MQVVKYLNKVPVPIGNKIGEGADGEVFEIENLNKVIKFSIIGVSNLNEALRIKKQNIEILNFIMNNPSKCFAKIYEFDSLGNHKISNQYGTIHYSMYYTIMEKLNPISKIEYETLKSIIYNINNQFDYSDKDSFQNLSKKNLNNNLKKIKCSRNLSERIKSFHQEINSYQVIHNDIGVLNIMKSNSDFKLIDFDRCEMRK